MKARTTKTATDCLEYTGPIRRADGAVPYYWHLWPLPRDEWWASWTLHRSYDSDWHFSVVGLADGRWSVDGNVYNIRDNDDQSGWRGPGPRRPGRPVVFPTREAAIRVAAARMLRAAHSVFRRPGPVLRLTSDQYTRLVHWTLRIVAQETGGRPARTVAVYVPPPEPVPTGLPLFDHAAQKGR